MRLSFIQYPVFIMMALALAFPAYAQDKFLDIKEVTTPSGITAWLVEDHAVPVIAMKIGWRNAGAKTDPEGKEGRAQLASNTMDEGAGTLDSTAFQQALADHSITLTFDSGRDSYMANLKTLTRTKDKAFALLKLALTEPRFDTEAVDRMRDANMARVRRSLSDPGWMAARIMNDRAYEGHPYARNSGGSLTSLVAVTPEDLRAFQQNELTRERLVIGVAGDIDAETLALALEDIFGALPSAPEEGVAQVPLSNQGQGYFYAQDIPQTVVSILMPGPVRDDPDYEIVGIMDYIFGGGGFGSRLMERAREKGGLTYGIYSGLVTYDEIPGIAVNTSTENGNVTEILSLITEEMTRMKEKDVSPETLQAAKDYLIGSMPLSLSSTDAIAGLLLALQVNDLGIDYLDRKPGIVEGVTQKDIRAQAQKWLDPEAMVTVLTGGGTAPEGYTTIERLPGVE